MTEELAALRASAGDLLDPYLSLLASLVTLESPSGDVDRNLAVAALLRAELERRGATVERHPAPGLGEHLTARFSGPRPASRRSWSSATWTPCALRGRTRHRGGTGLGARGGIERRC